MGPTHPDILVVGAGVIGLTVAAEALQRGARTEIRTRHLPADTTSAVAAAMWYPFLAEPRERVLAWSRETFDALARLARDAPDAGVRMTPFVEVFTEEEPDVWWTDAVPSARFLARRDVPDGFRAALHFHVPVADTRRYLPWLQQRVMAAGGEVTTLGVDRLMDVTDVPTRAVVNCSGLGARELCGDTSLVPIRGQVVVARRNGLELGVVDDTGDQPVYAIPRGDQVVLGGTAQRADERATVVEDDTKRIIADLERHVPGLASAEIIEQKVGLRPWRPTLRLEAEELADGARVVHCYGHGGSGYTVAWGCAREAIDLALDSSCPAPGPARHET